MTVEGPASVEPGEPDHATISLRAKSGYKVNEEAPLRVTVDSVDVQLPRKEFGAGDAASLAPEEVKVEVPFAARSEGPTSLQVHAHYGVCDDESCAICRERRQLETLSK
jgi:hypothetical protein